MAREDSDRQRRLAEALRANLRRRKGQARERDHTDEADSQPAAPASSRLPADPQD